ncbi:MAG TPA: NAD(P)/FAD-dependent oxidoreductase [Polyangiales bacterium]|nr:NAD(P)/FAD-dependent oxidoreductase [Polyangiales bacterium]
MARAPVFRGVERALRLAWASERFGLSHDALLEARASRRAFLKGAAAAAGLAAVSCGRAAWPGQAAPDVAVIGAGLAGLSCAYRLHAAGVRVRVYEAQARVGGRVYSLRGHFPDAHVVELGGELIDSGHLYLRDLAAELGFTLDDLSAGQPTNALWYFDGASRSEREVVEAFRPIAAAIQRDLASLERATLDAESLAAWFDRHGASGWIRSLLEVAYTTEMGLPCEQQSALNLLGFISAEPDPFRVFGASDERYHVRGGNDAIPRELARRLGAAVETECVLEALRRTASGDFELDVRRGSSSRQLRASHVVLALPLSMLRRVRLDLELPPLQLRAIRELAYGTNAKLMLGCARRIWRDGAASDGSTFSDLPYQTSWETTRAQPGESGVLVNFTGGARGLRAGQGSTDDEARRVSADLERVYPGFQSVRAGMPAVRFHWPSHAWTEGSYVCLKPGDWTTFARVFDAPSGRLHFAGEHCSADAQGFMEGACESGQRVASRLLAEWGITARLRAPSAA